MFKLTVEISDQQVQDLLVCALEGGSNYWYRLENENDDTSKPYWERVFDTGLNISNALADDADTNPVRVKINRNTIQNALELMQASYPKHFQALVTDHADAETGDVFLQLCVFGQLIYG